MAQFYALQKPVSHILKKNKEFFNLPASIRKIIVMGHSLNKIDLPYFKEIAKCAPDASWTVFCHNLDEKEYFIKALSECGVLNENIVVSGYP